MLYLTHQNIKLLNLNKIIRYRHPPTLPLKVFESHQQTSWCTCTHGWCVLKSHDKYIAMLGLCHCFFEALWIKLLTPSPPCSLPPPPLFLFFLFLQEFSDITTEDATSCHCTHGPGDLKLAPRDFYCRRRWNNLVMLIITLPFIYCLWLYWLTN